MKISALDVDPAKPDGVPLFVLKLPIYCWPTNPIILHDHWSASCTLSWALMSWAFACSSAWIMFSLCCSSSWMHVFCVWISLITSLKKGCGAGVEGVMIQLLSYHVPFFLIFSYGFIPLFSYEYPYWIHGDDWSCVHPLLSLCNLWGFPGSSPIGDLPQSFHLHW